MYNITTLQNLLLRDKANIIGEYSVINRETTITFRCLCGKESIKTFRRANENSGFFCKECTQKQNLEKRTKTNIEKYGLENCSQRLDVKLKKEQTCLDHFGEKSHLKSPQIIENIQNTNTIKYGCKNVFGSDIIKIKIKKTLLEKYGVSHPSKSEILQEKKKETFMERYGVEHSSQNPQIMSKTKSSAFKKKEYILPSNKIVLVQGYEPHALDILIKNNKYSESDIIVGEEFVPEIWYYYNDKKRRYYTDIYLKSENKFIEVKSTFIYNKEIDKNIEKHKAVLDMGYLCEFWIFDRNKKLNIIKSVEQHTIQT